MTTSLFPKGFRMISFPSKAAPNRHGTQNQSWAVFYRRKTLHLGRAFQ